MTMKVIITPVTDMFTKNLFQGSATFSRIFQSLCKNTQNKMPKKEGFSLLLSAPSSSSSGKPRSKGSSLLEAPDFSLVTLSSFYIKKRVLRVSISIGKSYSGL